MCVARRSAPAEDGQASLAANGAAATSGAVPAISCLLVTDLAMPNMDGLELCRRLRAASQVPIIVLSARGDEKAKVELEGLEDEHDEVSRATRVAEAAVPWT